MSYEVTLRPVHEDDLVVFFHHQLDPEANRMGAFTPRTKEAFMAHWAGIMRDETVITRTVVVDGRVAGNVVSFEREGRREVGYWIGKEYWGKGVATTALSAFLDEITTRPLNAHVAKQNLPSLRVLEKCGFVRTDEAVGADGVEELVLTLAQ